MSRHVCIFAISSKARHARYDQPRVEFQEDFGGREAHLFKYTGAEGINEDVGLGDETFDESEALRGLGIDCYAAFPAGQLVRCWRRWVGGRGMSRWVGAINTQDCSAIVG